MGAVTALLYAAKIRNTISCLILDSPFSNLKKVLAELGKLKTKMPAFLVEGAISNIYIILQLNNLYIYIIALISGKIEDMIG